jgi:hypothetical protein
MEYIEQGLDQLIKLLNTLKISSVAIPPLGSGNGGLIWAEVKSLIQHKMEAVSEGVDVFLYEPSCNYTAKPVQEPKLSLSALVLMTIKMKLDKFSRLRLQKTAFLVDALSGRKYFSFKNDINGPNDRAIDLTAKSINEFQIYHGTKNTEEAYNIALGKLISKNVQAKLDAFAPLIAKAAAYVNRISNDRMLESITAILFILQNRQDMDERMIVNEFKSRCDDNEIKDGIAYLRETGMITQTLTGYRSI